MWDVPLYYCTSEPTTAPGVIATSIITWCDLSRPICPSAGFRLGEIKICLKSSELLMHSRVPVLRKQGHWQGISAYKLQKMKSCLSTAETYDRSSILYSSWADDKEHLGGIIWSPTQGPLSSVSGRSLKERKILFSLSLPHQSLLPPQEPVWWCKCSPDTQFSCFLHSQFSSVQTVVATLNTAGDFTVAL